MSIMAHDGFLARIRQKAHQNRLSIAVSSQHSAPQLRLEAIASLLAKNGRASTPPKFPDVFKAWNPFLETVFPSHQDMEKAIVDAFHPLDALPISETQQAVSRIPISNFIDLSIDGGLVRALKQIGREPVVSNCSGGQFIAGWQLNAPSKPTVFRAFSNLDEVPCWHGLYEPITRDPNVKIQQEKRRDMQYGRDLVLIGMHPAEAEHLLHLHTLSTAADRIYAVNCSHPTHKYWQLNGVVIASFSEQELLETLLPARTSEYSFWDRSILRPILDINRDRQHDCFLSHYSGDAEFAKRINQALTQRSISVWVDRENIKIGDSISDQVQNGLTNAYTFTILLTPDALTRPWVKEELKAATSLRIDGELPILPMVYKDCKLPPFLRNYSFADFRDEKRFEEQIEMLAESIQALVKQARGKGDGRISSSTGDW